MQQVQYGAHADRQPLDGLPLLHLALDAPVERDGGLEPADLLAAAERPAGTVTDGRSVTVDGTGHYPHLEKPEVFTKTLLDFLRGLPGPPF
ncbi:hypothetical protein GCM10010254_50230 [Streptomyces chromofuscus]|nr:hypothetical protein GCM10010254_50230 [Streptomyces chromofuscus]